MRIELVTATDDRLKRIADNINPRDADELMASVGWPPYFSLVTARDVSCQCLVAERDGIPQAVYGIADCGDGVGSPWMLSTGDMVLWRRRFMSISRAVVSAWRTQFHTLTNFIDARNTVSIRWLEALGFTMAERVEHFGVAGVPFYRFEMTSPQCASP